MSFSPKIVFTFLKRSMFLIKINECHIHTFVPVSILIEVIVNVTQSRAEPISLHYLGHHLLYGICWPIAAGGGGAPTRCGS